MIFLYTLTIFVSAMLLFLVQPMFARLVLPALGGSPAVWNTVLVFFQAALLAGYAYAHFSTRWLGARRQAALHGFLILLPLLVLPIALPEAWRPPTQGSPVASLMEILLTRVGLPFFVIATTSPLLQRWFSQSGHKAARDPYFLYAASNCGSMLALLSYPFIVEPRLTLGAQSRLWQFGYIAFVLLMLGCVVAVWRRAPAMKTETASTREDNAAHEKIAPRRIARWVALAFVPSSLMMSVAQYLSTDIAAIPLLWIIPLALYLLTFILVFAARPPIPHALVVRAVPILVLPLAIAVAMRASQPILLLLPLHLLAFFFIAMMCHGELAADRPAPRDLTTFYLWMSVGGVLGGAFNALLAPLIFSTLLEYPIVIALACALLPFGRNAAPLPKDRARRARVLDFALPLILTGAAIFLVLGLQKRLPTGAESSALMFGVPALLCFPLSRRPLRFALAVAGVLLAGTFFLNGEGKVLLAARSFFGVHRVTLDRGGDYHSIVHGGIIHGKQATDPARQRIPLSYYYPGGPVNQVFDTLRARGGAAPVAASTRAGLKVAVVGLGAGALAAYAKSQDNWTFYEIDPVVEYIATTPRYFTYLRDCRAPLKIVLGDGRLSLQSALDASYDFLILDAYSSDALPVHLITRQALQLYRRKLKPDGLLLFNISNLHLDLEPVLGNLARDLKMPALAQFDVSATPRELQLGKTPSAWLVMAPRAAALQPLLARRTVGDHTAWHAPRTRPDMPVWTDDYSSLISVFKWNENQVAEARR